MKIENFEIITDKEVFNNIPNKELNNVVKLFIEKNKFKNFCEKITFKLKNSNIGLINSIRHACYKIDSTYYLDADFSDVKLLTDDNIYIHAKYLLNRLRSVPINQTKDLDKYVDQKIGKLEFKNNRKEQYSDVTTQHLKFDIKEPIIANTFRLYQLIYSKAILSIENIHLRLGYNKDNCTHSNVHSFSIIPINTLENSSSTDFTDFDITISTNGISNFFDFINKIIDLIITNFEKKYILIKDNDDNILSILYENENLIFENLILEYGFKNKFSPIINIKNDNVYIKNLSEDNLKIIINNSIAELNEFKKLINLFNK